MGLFRSWSVHRQSRRQRARFERFHVGSTRCWCVQWTLHDFIILNIDAAVVTSFDTARRSVSLLDSLPWTVLIVDEAHRLKNPKSSTTQALASFYWPESHPIPTHVTELTPALEPGSSNSQSASGQSTTPIPRTGPLRFALTGTAIQNSYMELWTLLDFVNPGSVGTEKQWQKTIAYPLAAGQARGSKEEERLRASRTAEILRDKLLPLYFLRR